MILFTLAVGRVASQHEICSDSTVDVKSFTPAKRTDYRYGGLFIDSNNRVPCDSLVTGWYICYFLPQNSQIGERYYVQLSIFKHDLPFNGILYIQRPETTVRTYVRNTPSIDRSGDTCGTVSLPIEYQFTVYKNEFIGVYIEEEEEGTGLREGNILDVIGNTTSKNDTVIWRCPRSDNTIITALDAYSSCFQTLSNHQVRAKLLVSTQTAAIPNTGLNDTNLNLPPLQPQPITSTHTSTYLVPRKPTHVDTSTVTVTTSTQLFTTSSTLHSKTVNKIQQLTNTQQPIKTSNTPATLLPFTNTTEGQQSASVLIPLSVTGACVIAILIAAIASIGIVICVHHRRKAKLELMKWRQERRNIMTGK